MKTLLLSFAAAGLLDHAVFAQTSTSAHAVDVPPVVGQGFEAFQKDGGQAALTIWLKGSPVENDSNTRLQVAGGLSTIQSAYGRITGWETIRAVRISESVTRVYAVAKHERGPVFFRFDCYHAAGGWIIPALDMNTAANSILPPNLLGGQ